MRILIAMTVAILAHTATAETADRRTYPANEIKKIVFENGTGNLDVATHQEKIITVSIDKRDFDEKNCTLVYKQIGKELLLKVDRDNDGFFAGDCDVDFQVRVPHASALAYDINIGAGNVKLTDIEGELNFNLGTGDVSGIGLTVGSLAGKSGAGNIDIKGTVEKGELTLGVGNASVVLTATKTGSLNIKTGTGNAIINLPQDANVSTDATSGIGNVTNQVTNREDAPYQVSVSTGIGNATLRHF